MLSGSALSSEVFSLIQPVQLVTILPSEAISLVLVIRTHHGILALILNILAQTLAEVDVGQAKKILVGVVDPRKLIFAGFGQTDGAFQEIVARFLDRISI